jgi:acyl carrier protein
MVERLNKSDYQEEKTMIKEKVIEVLAQYKDCAPEEIDVTQSFEELKLDSLDTVEIVMNLEEAFEIELKITEELKTVQDVIDAITKLV